MSEPETDRISLRPAVAADFDRLLAIHRAAIGPYVEQTWGWDDPWQARQFRARFEHSHWNVICHDGVIAGYIEVRREANSIFLANIEIHPDHQGRGIGTHLIRELFAEADRRGVAVTLQVLKTNPRARALYDRLGFTPTGETATHIQMHRLPRNRR